MVRTQSHALRRLDHRRTAENQRLARMKINGPFGTGCRQIEVGVQCPTSAQRNQLARRDGAATQDQVAAGLDRHLRQRRTTGALDVGRTDADVLIRKLKLTRFVALSTVASSSPSGWPECSSIVPSAPATVRLRLA